MPAIAYKAGLGVNVDLQASIDAAAEGAVIDIVPTEYHGPFVVRKPLTLRGGLGTTLCCKVGPVLTVDASGVVLENLIIEVLGDATALGAEGCALQVNSGHGVLTRDVQVKGSVIGVSGDEGIWNLPPVLEFKGVAAIAGIKVKKEFRVAVPAPCALISKIDGLEVSPARLAEGEHTIELMLDVGPGANILGNLCVCTPTVWRRIQVTAHTFGAPTDSNTTSILRPDVSRPVAPPASPRPVTPAVSPRPAPSPVYPRPILPPPSPRQVPPPVPLPRRVSPGVAAPRPPWKFNRLRWMVAAILVLALVTGGWWWLRSRSNFNFKSLVELPKAASSLDAVTAMTFSPGDDFLALGVANNEVRLIGVSSGELMWHTTRHDAPVRAIAFSSDGRKLASGGDDFKIVLHDAVSGDADKILRGPNSAVRALAFSPDGKRLVAGLQDSTVRIWDAASGELLMTLTRHDGPVSAVAFSPDGKILATGGNDNKIILWNPDSGKDTQILRGYNGGLLSLAIADNNLVAAGFQDGGVRLWDDGHPMPKLTLSGHAAPVRGVVFSPSGQSLASVSDDGALRLWRTSDGEMIRTLHGEGGRGGMATLSADGCLLADGGSDGAVRVWKCE